MTPFVLDERLARDSHLLLIRDDIQIRLHDNALWPWLMLVPQTEVVELCLLPDEHRSRLLSLMNDCGNFILAYFPVEKLNIAAIGNVVSQLHVHVVGRRRDDPAWPGVVWGFPGCVPSPPDRVAAVGGQLSLYFENR